jgi:hypothetical protein
MAHQGGQLHQVLGPELVLGYLKSLLADFVGLEKLGCLVDYSCFVGAHRRQRFFVS